MSGAEKSFVNRQQTYHAFAYICLHTGDKSADTVQSRIIKECLILQSRENKIIFIIYEMENKMTTALSRVLIEMRYKDEHANLITTG